MAHNKWNGAIQAFREAREIDPYMELTVFALMECYGEIGDLSAASNLYRTYVNLADEDEQPMLSHSIRGLYERLTSPAAR